MTHPTAAERYRAHMEATTARNRFLAIAGVILLVAALLFGPGFVETFH